MLSLQRCESNVNITIWVVPQSFLMIELIIPLYFCALSSENKGNNEEVEKIDVIRCNKMCYLKKGDS